MSLFDKINEDIKQAMLKKEKERLEALRGIKAAFLVARTEKGASGELSSDAEIKVLQKMLKQRQESADIYQQQNRMDLYQVEIGQAEVIKEYMPAPMSEEEIVAVIKQAIDKTGAKGPSAMGMVMGIVTKELSGKADGKFISSKVKELLG
jgi:uncharacterized protein